MSGASTPSRGTPLSCSTPSTPSVASLDYQNSIDPSAKWLVQKYGGTSVGKFAAKIAEDILPYAQSGLHTLTLN
jgi:aspartate kinase